MHTTVASLNMKAEFESVDRATFWLPVTEGCAGEIDVIFSISVCELPNQSS